MDAPTTIRTSRLNAGGNININTHQQFIAGPPIQDPLKELQKRAALGALHDSAERPDPPKCHPRTRQAVQNQINQWARDRSADARPVLWLTGPAGAGKSAIAQTMVERWKKENLIVPNFFCWRSSPKRNRKTHIVTTLAFQLAKSSATVRTKIEEAVKDQSIFKQNLESQVEQLIVGPLENILANEQVVVIVIDGLDEVRADLPRNDSFPGQSYEEQQREVLEAIALACRKLPLLRIFIASRPERQIRTSFAESPLECLSLPITLVNEFSVNADITLYLKCKFAEIRQRHPGIDPSWPSDSQISLLLERSSGQFIYPSTVVKYISRGRQFPVKSLEDVLELRARSDNTREHPLAELDALYTFVLGSVMPESWPTARFILGLASYGSIVEHLPRLRDFGPRRTLTLPYLEDFMFLCSGELSSHLTDLHSVLFIPSSQDLFSEPIHLFHTTLSEYLRNPSRSGNLSVNEREVNAQCSTFFIRYMQLFSLNKLQAEVSTQLNVYRSLLHCISRSSPSADLMMSLWDLLKPRIGEYNANNAHPPEPRQTGLGGVIFSGLKDKFTGQHQEEVKTLEYLLECNIPELEPSQPHREVIDRRLKEFLVRFNPEHPIAVRYVGCRNTLAAGEEL